MISGQLNSTIASETAITVKRAEISPFLNRKRSFGIELTIYVRWIIAGRIIPIAASIAAIFSLLSLVPPGLKLTPALQALFCHASHGASVTAAGYALSGCWQQGLRKGNNYKTTTAFTDTLSNPALCTNDGTIDGTRCSSGTHTKGLPTTGTILKRVSFYPERDEALSRAKTDLINSVGPSVKCSAALFAVLIGLYACSGRHAHSQMVNVLARPVQMFPRLCGPICILSQIQRLPAQ